MLRVANILSVIVVIASSALAFFYYHDDMDIQIPYLEEMFLGSALLLGTTFLIKISSRWPALFTAMKSKGYQLSLKGFKKVIIYEGIVLLYLGVFAMVMLKYIDVAFFAGIAGLLLFFEGLTLLMVQLIKSPFRVMVNDKAITKITNEWEVVAWNDLRKIDSRQNDIHLILKSGSPVLIDLEWIEGTQRDEFIAKMNEIAQQKGIYCSIDCVGEYKDFTKEAAQPICNK